jgi:hypothetical protein
LNLLLAGGCWIAAVVIIMLAAAFSASVSAYFTARDLDEIDFGG